MNLLYIQKIWRGLGILTKNNPELNELVKQAASLPKNTCPRCERFVYGDICKKCKRDVHDETAVDPTVYHKKDSSVVDVHEQLYAKLFGVPCITLSGRMRGNHLKFLTRTK